MENNEDSLANAILVAAARREWRQLTVVAGLSVAGGLLAVAAAFGLTGVLDGVFLGGMDRAGAAPWLLALLLIAALRAGLSWWEENAALDLAATVMEQLRCRVLDHLLALGPVALANEAAGRLLQVAGEGVDSLEGFYAGYLPQLIRAVTTPLLVLSFVLPLDAVSAAIMLITAPLIPLFMILIGRLAEERNKRQWQMMERLGSHFYDVLSGLATLKLFGRSREQAAVIRRLDEQLRTATLGVLRIAFLSALVLELLAALSTAVVAVTVGLRLLNGTLTFTQAFFVLLLAPEYYLALRLLGSQFHAGLAGRAAARDIARLLSLPAAPDRVPIRVSEAPEGNGDCGGKPAAIRLRGVWYAYPEREAVLRGLELDLAAGEKLALVGESGGGKSTLLRLLCGLMPPDAGEIWVDGCLLTGKNANAWRRRLAVVSQRPYIFHRSVLENIRLGRPAAGREMVETAARQALADEFIRALPQGYDTVLSSGGGELSGGQRQRLALARTFLQDPDLIILDEAARGLDPVAEEVVQAAMDRLTDGKTLLVITHRLNIAQRADRIAVLAGGQVAECGSHEELLLRDGLYRKLWRSGREAPGHAG